MIFNISLYLALGVFLIGLGHRIFRWFSITIGIQGQDLSTGQRLSRACKGIACTVFSSKTVPLLKALFLDVLFQRKLLQASPYRWASHMLVFWGFCFLLFMHALEAFFLRPFIEDYASTQNPYLFLRNMAAFVVLTGLAMMMLRKKNNLESVARRNAADKFLLFVLGILLISGIFLESTKITSETRFQQMVAEYSDEDDPGAIKALEFYWTKYYGLVSSAPIRGNMEDLLAKGRELHETSCASCHARPQWAFLSYGVAKGIAPVASSIDVAGGSSLLWFIHFLTAFAALALFPFTKLFHLLASPISLLANAAMDDDQSDPANIATRQAMELDACTHCGLCTQICAVQMAYFNIPNANILPSEKIAHLKRVGGRKELPAAEVSSLLEGLYLCTNCHRCTDVCPVGINLQSMWFMVREAYLQRGIPEPLTLTPFSFFRGLKQDKIDPNAVHLPLSSIRSAIDYSCNSEGIGETAIILKNLKKKGKKALLASDRGRSLSYCYTCTTCSSVCPVARVVDNAPKALGLLPHQIIRAVNLGLTDTVFRSEMLWSCLSCYMCQEACPQGVRVADIISELKILASSQVKNYISNHVKDVP